MRRKWTADEEKYLLERYLNQSTKKTADKLGRTVVSVKRKAARMGLNHYLDNISAKAIARCFGCDVSVVLRWIEKMGLPTKKIVCKNQTRYSIDPMEFWEWADENRSIINWARYEENSLAPQPEWVKEEIKKYQTVHSRKRFTFHEKANIVFLLKKGMTCEEVAAQVGRSLYSIRHVSRKMGKER